MSQLSAESTGLSQDEVFTILKNPRRRHVIRYLQGNGGESTVRELTAEVAAIENDLPVEELAYDQRKAVYTSLYQTHLPRLDESGVVEYDRRSGNVWLTEQVADCDAHLAVADGGTRVPEEPGNLGRWALVGSAHLILGLSSGWVVANGGGWLGALGLGAALALTVGVWYYWYATGADRADRTRRRGVSDPGPGPSD